MRPFATLLVGIVLGSAAAAWLGPKIIHWYAQPPFTMGCDCGPAMGWAMGKLVLTEAIGAGIGAVVAVVIFFVLGSRRRRQVQPPLETAAAPK